MEKALTPLGWLQGRGCCVFCNPNQLQELATDCVRVVLRARGAPRVSVCNACVRSMADALPVERVRQLDRQIDEVLQRRGMAVGRG
jgi:hypothetical protein